MIKTLQKSAKTEEEALRLALEELGLTRDDVSVEIVERAKSGFLGLGATPATISVSYEVADVKTDRVREFLAGLIERFGAQADIEASDEVDGTVSVVLSGSEPGALIGRRGETLDAIQHLTNYAVNRGGGGRLRINIDAENYRQRRGDTLEALAAKTAAKVLKYRRSITLDPMNAYERHVIHTALQENEGVSTHSVGSEPNRRVVVAYGKSGEEQQSFRPRERRPERREPSAPRPEPVVSEEPVYEAEIEESAETAENTQYREWK
ncbi:MAG: protein jag [Oscillospiraceae bacterium]|jgi:spoIIIJ-associated protein|nr:protein jag [Oscillospiraceae bacterium]